MNNVSYLKGKALLDTLGIDTAALEEIYPNLTKPLISIASTGVLKRNFSHWKKEGLIESKGKERTWVKLNLFEFLWLRIIQISRDFGVSIPAILEMKKTLDLDILNILKASAPSAQKKVFEMHPNANKKQTPAKINLLNLALEMGEQLPEEQKIYRTLFSSIVGNVLLLHEEISLIYYKSGKTLEHFIYLPKITPPEIEDILNGPHLKIPLRSLIEDFFDKPETEKFAESFGLINHYERKLLDILRSNEFQEIRVYNGTSKQGLKIVPISDQKKRESEAKKLFLLLGRNQYKKIVIKLKDKKMVTLKNKLELHAVNK
jgi:hypothetical protein